MRISLACATVASVLLCPAAFADSAAFRAEDFDASKKSMETPNHTFLSQIESGQKSDAQTWISKNQGLILKYEAHIDDMTITLRYVYADIRAPSNAKGPDQ